MIATLVRALLCCAGLLASADPVRAQLPTPTAEDVNHSRGLSVASAYQLDDFDSINLFSGGLTVSLPLGIEYPVGGGLSYRFSVHCNSNVWDFSPVNTGEGTFETAAEPDSAISNAGLGWTFSLGRLFPPNTPGINDNPSTWLLLEGDGSRRKFSSGLHTWGSSATTTFSYTRDGSYLRMRRLANGEREVESGKGTIRVFRADGWLRQIRDRFGNALNITYDLNLLTWTLSDSTGRSHVVSFEADPTDPEPIIALARKRLKTLDLAAFDNSRAIYSFEYSRVFIQRPSKDSSSTTGPTVEVSLLDSITLPDDSSFEVTTIRSTADKRNVFEESGMVRSLTLPTLGEIEWEYSLYTFPAEQPGFEEGPNPWSTGSGLSFKRLYDKHGGLVATWEYRRGARPPSQPAAPPITGAGAFEVRTWVTDPLGHQTVHYFQNDPADFGYGLPFTKLLQDASGTRFLSREAFDGAATAASRKRSSYLRYESDPATVAGNERVVSERTDFDDDGNRSLFVDRSDFDGFGHYRSTQTSDTFANAPSRSVFQDFNPARGTLGQVGFSEWPTSSQWVLETFTEERVTEASGASAKRQLCFDAGTGFLLRERIMTGVSPGGNDVLRVYTRNGAGELVQEQHYGGDLQPLSTSSNLCGLARPSSELYRIDHTYQNGALATSQYKTSSGGNLGFFHVNRTIDRNTGLASSSTDTAGLITDFEYDALGRRTWIMPRPTGGVDRDGWVELVHVRARPTLNAQVLIWRRGTGAKNRPILARGRTIFDDLGRVAEERTRVPSGQESCRRYFYNGLGLQTHVSELALLGEPRHDTRFMNYDPFGRPRRIQAPDGKIVEVVYFGIRREDRTTSLGTSHNPISGAISESSVTTRQIFDRRGDLRQVFEDSGVGDVLTEYFYDVGGRLNRVEQVRGGVTQERTFTYDNRGFLLSERHPERGPNGNGFVQYFDYDPMGNPGRRADVANSLTLSYDRAERLTRIRQSFQLQRVQKEFVYATGSGFSDKRAGKLIAATRHNYFDEFNVDLAITESYVYGGREGRVSVKGTNLSSGDAYTQGYTWNELGGLQSLVYPDCLQCPPGVEPARTVSYGYTEGLLSSIPGWASSITYHPNGMIDRISLQNGVVWTQGRDANDIRRPASITATRGGTTVFSTGSYRYDGSGNVVKMGLDYFLYDRFNRLVEGTALQAGGSRRQTYAYDGFSNMTAVTTWSFGSPSTRNLATSPSTNRLSAASYDSTGAMTSWGSFTYERDPLGMIRALEGGGLDLRYAYTASDERFLEFDVRVFGSVWRLRDLDGQVIREIHLDNRSDTWTWQKDWIRREGKALASVDALEGTRYLHADHLGTTRAITNGSGTHTASLHLFPFGEVAAKAGVSTEAMQFTGHERDEHALTGGAASTTDDLDYMHARYYNPALGRFLRVDPGNLRSATALPGSWNRYAYAVNHPLVLHDPDGENAFAAVATPQLLFAGASTAGAAAAGSAAVSGSTAAAATASGVGAAAAGSAAVSGSAASAVVAGGAVVVVGGASFLAGRLIGGTEIGGTTIDARISDVLSDVIVALSSRAKPGAPGRGGPPPTAIPGARPKETPIPYPETPTKDKPATADELWEALQDARKRAAAEAAADVLGEALGTPADRLVDDF